MSSYLSIVAAISIARPVSRSALVCSPLCAFRSPPGERIPGARSWTAGPPTLSIRAVNAQAHVRTQSAGDPTRLVDALAGARIGETFNQYRDGPRAPLLRERLGAYLDARRGASLVLVGEAPGYRGARVSGIPFTSERQLTGSGPAEATATIVHRVLRELGLEDDVLLWNVVPTHPGTDVANRPPSAAEVAGGLPWVERVASGRPIVAVGRVAERATGAPAVRHPSHGGAAAFAGELASRLREGPR